MAGGLCLTGCAQNSPQKYASNNRINGTGWLLQQLYGHANDDTPVTLNFEAGTLNGNDGCNRYSGAYILDGKKISVAKIANTMMACPTPIMQRASKYMLALSQANAYEVRGHELTLLNSDGEILASFTRQSRELGGTSWSVTAYNNGRQAVVSVIAASALTAVFETDGKILGVAGCNHYTANYEASGMSLRIGPPSSTRKICADQLGLMEQEAQFLRALEAATTYRVDGNKLELRKSDGEIAIVGIRN